MLFKLHRKQHARDHGGADTLGDGRFIAILMTFQSFDTRKPTTHSTGTLTKGCGRVDAKEEAKIKGNPTSGNPDIKILQGSHVSLADKFNY